MNTIDPPPAVRIDGNKVWFAGREDEEPAAASQSVLERPAGGTRRSQEVAARSRLAWNWPPEHHHRSLRSLAS